VLVAAARGGDVARFGELVRRHEARVRAIVGRSLRDEESAAEATQHAFFLAWRHLDGLADAERFEAWLVRIAERVAQEAVRRRARERGRVASQDERDDRQAGVARHAAPAAPDRAIWDEVAQLSPLLREAIELRYGEGLSYAEVAARLGVPHSTVRGRIHEARLALRRRLEDER
jgi:RNA polymerase sigma-70 factor (ECF subfamily)